MSPYTGGGPPRELANEVKTNHDPTINCTSSSTEDGIDPSVGHEGTWRS